MIAGSYEIPVMNRDNTHIIPFTEQEIIDMSNSFLTYGFHSFKAKTIAHGRLFINTFLHSLNYYDDIAYLTVEQGSDSHGLDLYQLFNQEKLLEKPSSRLSEFLCNFFHNDFLWIEATPSLMAMPWFIDFEHCLIDLNIDKVMPIVILSYDKNI